MKTSLTLGLALLVSVPAFAKEIQGMALSPKKPRIEVVEIDLKNLSSIPVMGGYGDADSDANSASFIEPICKFMGYDGVDSSLRGWSHRDRTPTVMAFTVGREPYAYKINLQTNENVSLVKRLKCFRVKG